MRVLIFLLLLPLFAFASGDMTISNGHITLKTCSHDAGAVCSVKFRGVEYIDDHDHGRQIQSATVFNHLGENYNPTEAGSVNDGLTPNPSSSKLLGWWNSADVLATHTQMAFWKPVNGVKLSSHTMNKQISVGAYGIKNVILHQLQHNVPSGAIYAHGQFEVLTGYMPPSFSVFKIYNPATDSLSAISDGPGEQKHPIIISTPDGQHAMGAWSPYINQSQYKNAGYGRWRFGDPDNVNKWNVVYRHDNPRGSYHFRTYVFVGTAYEVMASMRMVWDRYN